MQARARWRSQAVVHGRPMGRRLLAHSPGVGRKAVTRRVAAFSPSTAWRRPRVPGVARAGLFRVLANSSPVPAARRTRSSQLPRSREQMLKVGLDLLREDVGLDELSAQAVAEG